MARKEQKAPNYTAGGLELYGQACFALRQSAQMFVDTVDRYKGEIPSKEVIEILYGQARRSLAMFVEEEGIDAAR